MSIETQHRANQRQRHTEAKTKTEKTKTPKDVDKDVTYLSGLLDPTQGHTSSHSRKVCQLRC